MKIAPLLLLAGLLTPTLAAEWPEFRGPTADGLVQTEGLPTEWAEGKNIAWKTALPGLGWSTPAIADGIAWLTSASLDGTTQTVHAIDIKTGDIVWEQLLVTTDNPEPLANNMNTYATPSPVVADGRVYVHFGSYGTFCLDAKSRAILWQRRDLTNSHWRGPGSSPALWKDKLILTFDGADQQYLVALDTATGRTVWRRDRSTAYGDEDPKTGRPANSGDMRKGYSTPVFVPIDGVTHLVSNSAKACWAYDPDTGEELWHVNYPTHSPSSRPVFSQELGLIFINTGLGKAEIWAIRADAKARGDIGGTHVAWKLLKRTPKRSSPVLVGHLLFMANDGIAACADARTGELLWQERAGGEYSASLLSDGKHVWFFDEVGLCTVVKATATYEKVAENSLDAGCLASPAVADGALFVRTRTHLYRIGQ
ncbi:MAG: PQQ-binding-like beta-propeller repeat protein [Verrucomicrobiales bacterium]|nr:PQQ-binding-like beta-propeller repeat protein [Verrucomicrobiales bacterium]